MIKDYSARGILKDMHQKVATPRRRAQRASAVEERVAEQGFSVSAPAAGHGSVMPASAHACAAGL